MEVRKKPLHTTDAEQFRAIGKAIRDTRTGRYTLEALVARAGISIGQLSQIENGRGNPTVEMLVRIGEAFNVNGIDFIERNPPAPTHITRATERRTHVLGDGREVSLLTPGLRYDFTVTYMEFQPGESRQSQEYQGENVFYILDGQLSVHVGGTTYVLQAEDALVCGRSDRMTNAGTQPVKFIVCFRPEG
jgi:transcriptional regulator with XRE-family HTH domain